MNTFSIHGERGDGVQRSLPKRNIVNIQNFYNFIIIKLYYVKTFYSFASAYRSLTS